MHRGPTAGGDEQWWQLQVRVTLRSCNCCLDGVSMRREQTARMGRHWFMLHLGVTRRSCGCYLDGGSMRRGRIARVAFLLGWQLTRAMSMWCAACRKPRANYRQYDHLP